MNTEWEQEAAVAIIRPAWTPTVYKLLLSAVSPMVETTRMFVCGHKSADLKAILLTVTVVLVCWQCLILWNKLV